MDDREIILLLHARDERGLAAIRMQYGRSLRTLAGRIVETPEDAEEVVTDVLMRVWDTPPQSETDSLFPYLAQITGNAARNRLAHDSAQKRGGGEHAAVLGEISECVAALGGVEETVEEHALIEALNRFLGQLPEEAWRITVLRYAKELSVSEIAATAAFPNRRSRSHFFGAEKSCANF